MQTTPVSRRCGAGIPATLVSLVLAFSAVCGPCKPAAAQSADPGEKITVTGARESVPLADALQDVTVIDRATIESFSGASLESLLADQAGVQVSSSGGIGSLSSVFLRGANPSGTLLLIDGMRYGSASFGGPVFYNLPLDQIDHIEIVRGPLSALYGSDAAGGVIQVFTRRGEPGFHPGAAATVGSEAYGALDAGVRGGSGALDYAVQAGGQRTSGYAYTNSGAGFYFNPNRDGFSQTSASANVGYVFLPDWSLRVQGLGAHGRADYSDGVDPAQPQLTARNRFDSTTASVVLQGKVLPAWSTTLRYGDSRDNYVTDIATSPFSLGRFTTVQQQFSWQNDLATPIGTLLAGAEHLEQSVDSDTTVFPVQRRSINSFLLGLNGKAGPHHWQLNGRGDQNSQYGHEYTGAAAYGYDVAPQWRVTGSTGTSFVAPSFDDLYYPGSGNPLLRPQRGASRELAVRWKAASQEARLAIYDSRYRELIAYVGPNFTPENVNTAHIQGVTLEYSARFGPLSLSSALDAMYARDPAADTELQRRSRHRLSTTVDWKISDELAAGARVHAVGPAYDDAANRQSLGGYGVISVYGSWSFLPRWQAALRLDNLADHFVQPAYGFTAPPRQWFLTLRYGGI